MRYSVVSAVVSHTYFCLLVVEVIVWLGIGLPCAQAQSKEKEKLYLAPLNVEPVPITKDASVKIDYDIVFVRAPRPAGKAVSRWAEVGDPRTMDPGIVEAQNPVTLGFTIRVPGTYKRLAADAMGEFGIKPLHRHGWRHLSASRYVRAMQARRSLLIWKVYGERLDGFSNDDFVHDTVPGDPTSLRFKGKPVADTPQHREGIEIAFTGGIMPPPEAVADNYVGPDGRKIKVAPLTDEDRRTLVRWIDLGCPIDLDYDPAQPQATGFGWLLDDQRPTLTVTSPQPGANARLTRILVGMHDHGTGIDPTSFTVTADFAIDGMQPGANLASRFKEKSPGVHELRLAASLAQRERGTLTVSVRDRQGNLTRIDRVISVNAAK